MRVHRLLPGVLAVALFAGACTNDDPTGIGTTDTTDLEGATIALTSGLEAPGGCDALLDRLIDEGLERVGPYGFDQGYYWWGIEDDVAEEATSDSSGAADGDRAESAPPSPLTGEGDGGDFSGTNNQEAGVDEPDLVKTDGNRLVVITGNRLAVIDTTGDTPRLDTEIELPEDAWASEMFLVGDRVYVMVQGWTDVGFGPAESSRFGGSPTTKIIEVDLTTGRIGATLEFEGSYLSAREIDGSIRFVLSSGMGSFPFVYPSNQEAEEGAERANRAIIEESTIDQWLPSFRLTGNGDVADSGRIVDCEGMHLPEDFSGFGSIAVLTIDADRGLKPVHSIGIVTDGQTIYASTDRLTVATARYPELSRDGSPIGDSEYSTALHSFDISDPATTIYTGSGDVPGYLLSQYSLSEHNGYLRAATTAGDPWSGRQSESLVTVLEERDGVLETVGQVDGLGQGEQIFAVRFLGDVGYVVTFRQTDPLYVVDLTDPTAPAVTGELKIPGFSTYLHPLGDGLLMGVGQDATDEGFTTGSQASLFDVSDPSNPRRIDQIDLGTDSYTSVDWDPRAYTWWGPERLAFVPVSWWGYDEATNSEKSGSTSVVISAGNDGDLIEIGRIGHPVIEQCDGYYEEDVLELEREAMDDEATSSGLAAESTDAEAEFVDADEAPAATRPSDEYCWSYQPEVRRSVIIGETVYTVSEAGVKASRLDDLTDVAWIPLVER